MKKIVFALFAMSCALFAKPTVSTTILPTKYFVEQIAGDTLQVNTMVGKGADPHTYEPKPSEMKMVQNSDLYFAVGIEFDEIWLPKLAAAYPKMKIIRTEEGIEKMAMAAHHHDEHDAHHHHDAHDHGAHHDHKEHKAHHDHDEKEHHDHAEHHHHHDGLDPHIWLDPQLAKIQAKNIKDALTKQYPKNAKIYEANFDKFAKKLDELDAYAKQKLSSVKGKKFMVYHPSWGYFAHRYDLEQIAVEVEGKEPKPADLAELIEEAKEEKIKVIFVAPQFSKKAAQTIAAQTGAKVIEIDQLPLDWYETMKKTIDVFGENL